ncbi:putative reverse transcriptase domain-containing protein [Tanacetum coccineum]|uniref:Reverse transcriptase domain-containing protein n=1 Tax=Tanacetum coccineum TaxID=301880 RepID=A0ABQ4XWA8_9ASTR
MIQLPIISNRVEDLLRGFGRYCKRHWEHDLNMRTTYHPQTDGQSERTIQTLKDMLRAVEVGDKVMLEVSSWKEVVHFGKKEMLAPRYKYLADTNLHVHFEEKMSTQTHHNDEEPVEISSVSLKDLKRSSSGNPIMTLDEYSKRGPKNHRDNVRRYPKKQK